MERQEQIQSLRRSFSRLERFFSLLMREQFSCCPVTVQQWYALEALTDGAKSMNALAAEVALHQSTLTRIVEKLEKQAFVNRTRKPGNQRSVEVELTDAGRKMCEFMDQQCVQMTGDLLDMIPKERQASTVEAMEIFSSLLDPENPAFQQVHERCCCRTANEQGEEKCRT
ncbi:MAG: MarR family winged helix-turn-helix transcriptional regulator [Planctomycetota bacterium]|jgi:DNA-binding MarR family transcriptional regulator